MGLPSLDVFSVLYMEGMELLEDTPFVATMGALVGEGVLAQPLTSRGRFL